MSASGQEVTPFLLVPMAVACLYRLLIWALCVQLAIACLCCWPDAAMYFSYDVQHLVGGKKDVALKLEQLFLESGDGKCAIYGGKFLERDDMEREAGYLFLQLQQIVQKYGKDTDQLMTEAGREKQNFSKKLEKASTAFVKEICSASCGQIRFQPYELADCGGCRLLKASCKDSIVCAGPNVLAGVLVTLVILLGAGAGVWYYRRKKAGEGETKDQEDASTESSENSWSSEWSDDTDIASPPAQMTPTPQKARASDPPYQNVPKVQDTPYQNVPKVQDAPYQNVPKVPDTPYQNVPISRTDPSTTEAPLYANLPIPSPPHIWSP